MRAGLKEEQVMRYLESIDYAFQTILEQYNEAGNARDIYDILQITSEILEMLLFGVMQPQKEEQV